MLTGEVAGKLIVLAMGKDKLHFVIVTQRSQITLTKAATLARSRALHVNDLVHRLRHVLQRTLTAGLNQQSVSASQETLHHGDEFALLQHRLAAGKLNEPGRRQPRDLLLNVFHRHFSSAVKRVLTIAPCAAEIAGGQPDENAGHAGKRRFALNGTVNFDDGHLRVNGNWLLVIGSW